jgi:hypothetical protein
LALARSWAFWLKPEAHVGDPAYMLLEKKDILAPNEVTGLNC